MPLGRHGPAFPLSQRLLQRVRGGTVEPAGSLVLGENLVTMQVTEKDWEAQVADVPWPLSGAAGFELSPLWLQADAHLCPSFLEVLVHTHKTDRASAPHQTRS